jgi:RHS repeat-associated protein
MLREPAPRCKGTARGAQRPRARAIALVLIGALTSAPVCPSPQTPLPVHPNCGERGSGHGARARRERAARVALRFVRAALSRYDQRDRLKTLTYPDGRSLGYDYDPQGNRTKLTALLAGISFLTSYTFDPLNRLRTVTDPANRVSTYGYDENGNRQSLAQPNGAVTAYTYDSLSRLTSLETTIPSLSRTVQTYAFTLGPSGNRTRIVEYAGLPQQRTLDYSYDALYRLTGERVTESLGLAYDKAFAYDAVGNRQNQTTSIGPAGSAGPNLQAGTIGYGYDERDRLLSEQLGANPATAYGWDANGNLTTKDAEATYTWDLENRLVRVTKADGTIVEHAYDADGNRVRTKVTPPTGPPTLTDFLVDTSGSLSQVVAETDPTTGTPALKVLYIRGDDLLAVMRPLVPAPATASDWQTRYYHADGIGSIRRLTDENGTITDGYTYSAFGELLAHTGTDPQPYAFTGEPLDPNSGWQYHRARWLDPKVGRWTSSDVWPASLTDPSTLHRYQWVDAEPIARVDPTGLFTQRQGYLVEAALRPFYENDHQGEDFIFGRWARVGYWPSLKPDVFNRTQKNFMEIKPFSLSGIYGGAAQILTYTVFFAFAGYRPDIEWEPPTRTIVIPEMGEVAVFNLGGVLFYTDLIDSAEDLAALAVLDTALLVGKLRAGQAAASAYSEFATINRLAALRGSADAARIDGAVHVTLLNAITFGLVF